jgi:hypothetical protein
MARAEFNSSLFHNPKQRQSSPVDFCFCRAASARLRLAMKTAFNQITGNVT